MVRVRPVLKAVLERQQKGVDSRRCAVNCGVTTVDALRTAFAARLLSDTVLPSTGDSALAAESFIRRGMGWALRECAHAAPEAVAAFCCAYEDRLSPLTRREALKVMARRAANRGA